MQYFKFLTLLALLILSGCATAPYRTVKVDVVGVVMSSKVAPELCYEKNRNSTGKGVAGAIIGGLIGNQIGSGNGRAIATIAGTAAGAVIATADRKKNKDKYDCYSDGYENMVSFINPETNSFETKIIKTDRQKAKNTRLIFEHKYRVLRSDRT